MASRYDNAAPSKIKGFKKILADVKVKIKVAVPNPNGVDSENIAKSFPYGKKEVKVAGGGLRWHTGIVAPKIGDPSPEENIEAESSDDKDADHQ